MKTSIMLLFSILVSSAAFANSEANLFVEANKRLEAYVKFVDEDDLKLKKEDSELKLKDLGRLDYESRLALLESVGDVYSAGAREEFSGVRKVSAKSQGMRDFSQRVFERVFPYYVSETARGSLESMPYGEDTKSLVRLDYRNRMESVLMESAEIRPDIAEVNMIMKGKSVGTANASYAAQSLAQKACSEKKLLCDVNQKDDLERLSVAQLEADANWVDVAFIASAAAPDFPSESVNLAGVESEYDIPARTLSSEDSHNQ